MADSARIRVRVRWEVLEWFQWVDKGYQNYYYAHKWFRPLPISLDIYDDDTSAPNLKVARMPIPTPTDFLLRKFYLDDPFSNNQEITLGPEEDWAIWLKCWDSRAANSFVELTINGIQANPTALGQINFGTNEENAQWFAINLAQEVFNVFPPNTDEFNFHFKIWDDDNDRNGDRLSRELNFKIIRTDVYQPVLSILFSVDPEVDSSPETQFINTFAESDTRFFLYFTFSSI